MKREEAVRINHHLRDAFAALDRARMAIAGLGKAERIKLEDSFYGIVGGRAAPADLRAVPGS
jgi:hypothetical protein